eukprot:CAMPEP_0176114774 /NCGR_PEP_ID=MMETSP0120_2-20121206/57638_1 /TAXON_ID=160619 /ORGANISM="Kryptoperidinium foliaceum, Strain CCMP 1326" /LENGTH=59 /DNA_ID=CAMNT_0017449009 /DNA_START=24 /DNA_END=200 /DNA_ORIENTATION=-
MTVVRRASPAERRQRVVSPTPLRRPDNRRARIPTPHKRTWMERGCLSTLKAWQQKGPHT